MQVEVMTKKKNESFFWTSYSDLMTSLFFVMLVLFVICVVIVEKDNDIIERKNGLIFALQLEIHALQQENRSLRDTIVVSQEQQKKIQEIEKSIEEINKDYFDYDAVFKRHTLKHINVSFRTNSANTNDLSQVELDKLKRAGEEIVNFMKRAQVAIPEAQYLLIVEGQSSNDGYQYNYELSYQRALALVKYWTRICHINFDLNSNCEIIISGSGACSKFRELPDVPPHNQRFVIHIIPKPGIVSQ